MITMDEFFKCIAKSYNLVNLDKTVVRMMLGARWFKGEKTLVIDGRVRECGKDQLEHSYFMLDVSIISSQL